MTPAKPREFFCPVCAGTTLRRLRTDAGLVWACPSCEGRSLSIHPLRRRVKAQFLNELWQAARGPAARDSPRACPHCARKMRAVAVRGAGGEFELDVCLLCQFLWFDGGETRQLPVLPSAPPQQAEELSPAARQALAMLKAQSLADKARRDAAIERIGAGFSPERHLIRRLLGWFLDFVFRR